ncbi:MAG TPA: DUF6304 family protein [Kofleriaceae bacterium]|jgi:hypothetical protein
MDRYPGRYRDARGAEAIEIANDGHTLRTRIRGIELAGTDFDALGTVDDVTRAGLVLGHGSLCACELTWTMPIALDQGETGSLEAHLVLGSPDATGGIDREQLQLSLTCTRGTFRSAGTSGWFEDELLDLHKQLPSIRVCINCAFSDYSPAGHGLFGGLACFRDNKDAYRAVTGKQQLFQIWETMTEFVQETFVCGEFERRRPGAGYRG